MHFRYSTAALFAASIALAGCGKAPHETGATAPATSPSPVPATSAASRATDRDATPAIANHAASASLRGLDGDPAVDPKTGYLDVDDPRNLMPAQIAPQAYRGETGARSVLTSWARGIEERQFQIPYALFSQDWRANHSLAAFENQFDGMGTLGVAVPSGHMEGAAGSSYYSVPVAIKGSEGRNLAGTVVLRRVNDVDGASPAQLHWHVESADLKPA